MRQPEDKKTMDLLQGQGEKRGRGRPRIENPLSPAERARRYRERKAEQRELFSRDASMPVTQKTNEVFLLECRIRQLEAEVASYQKFCDDNSNMLESAQQRINALLAESNNSDATENPDDADFWRGMYEAQLERTVELEERIAAGRKDGWSYARITEITEESMRKSMERAASESDMLSQVQFRGHAYGAYLMWARLTTGWQAEGDDRRLTEIVEFW